VRLVLKPAGKPVRQRVECETCGEESSDESSVHEWALRHIGRRPRHRTFLVANETFWRLEPSGQVTQLPAAEQTPWR
jgi:hypothetical protein